MEDVILHYKHTDAGQLNGLVTCTEDILAPFPCRVLPIFSPWFPSSSDRWLPIRPSRSAPVLLSARAIVKKTQENNQPRQDVPSHSSTERSGDASSGSIPARLKSCLKTETTPHAEHNSKQEKDAIVISEIMRPNNPPVSCNKSPLCTRLAEERDVSYLTEPPDLHLAQLYPKPSQDIPTLSPEKPTRGQITAAHIPDRGVKRSWSVFAGNGPPLQSAPSMSKQFHKMVAKYQLHLRQRARWLICQHNWASARDMEQVWRELNRCIRNSRLPTCNANIQREQAQIWVFCDLLYSEYVGKRLKVELALSGQITLFVQKLGSILHL